MQQSLQSNDVFCFFLKGETEKFLMYPVNITDKYVAMCTQKNPLSNTPILPYSKGTYESLKHTNIIFYFPIENVLPFEDYSEDAWDKYSECEGCRYGYSNQEGHTC